MLEVNIGGNNSKFNAVMAQTSARVQAFSTQVTTSFSQMAQTSVVFTGVQAAIGQTVEALRQIPAAIGKTIAAAADMETQVTGFQVLLGSVDAAKERMEELADFATSTPFQLPEIARASRTLQTLTQGALATGAGLRMVGDVAAATGEPFAQLAVHVGRVYDGLQTGRAVGESLSRLQELGVISGETRSQIEALQAAGVKGTAVWNVAAQSFGKFSGMMDEQSATWAGLVSTIDDAMLALARDFGAPLIASLKPALARVIAMVEDFSGTAAQLGAGAAAAVQAVSLHLAALPGVLGAVAAAVALNTTGFLRFAATGPTVGASIAAGMRTAMAAVLQLQASMMGLSATWMTTGRGFGSALKGMGAGVAGLARSVAGAAKGILAALGPVNLAIMAATAAYTALMAKAARINAATDAVRAINKTSSKDARADVAAIKALASERERVALAATLAERLEQVRVRQRNVNDEFSQLDASGIERVTAALDAQAKGIEMTIRSIKKVPAAFIEANAAAVAAVQNTTKALEDSAKAQAKMVEDRKAALKELAEWRDDQAMREADTPQEKRKVLLSQSGVKDAQDMDAQMARMEHLIALGNASTTPQEVARLKELMAAKRELVGLEDQIAEAKESKIGQKQEALAEARRQIALLEAELSGDPDRLRDVQREQREAALASDFRAQGMTGAEADAQASRIAQLEALKKQGGEGAAPESVAAGASRAISSLAKIGAGGYGAPANLQREANGLLRQVAKNTADVVRAIASAPAGSTTPSYG